MRATLAEVNDHAPIFVSDDTFKMSRREFVIIHVRITVSWLTSETNLIGVNKFLNRHMIKFGFHWLPTFRV
jgi:hypothetical protein